MASNLRGGLGALDAFVLERENKPSSAWSLPQLSAYLSRDEVCDWILGGGCVGLKWLRFIYPAGRC